jgi:3-deoxy-D-manno-octulosonate 8-phosphate phosphatase KdsC-like HAD superfamily phosphatase
LVGLRNRFNRTIEKQNNNKKLIICSLDVDGVFTDVYVYYDANGEMAKV